ncbi:MAG TPA: glycosyltransferase family 4 protein [Acidimicrobiales bacterium]|nr:glycosyltransferase family 4 protein [Acidimicrobiales bacterium]
MKLGLLVPRYGEEVVGGTEHWLRLLLEHLCADRGWAAEVFTTTAVSAETWADDYPATTTTVKGVTVHRFASRSGRNPEYLHQLPRLRADPAGFSPGEAMEYVRLVGPVCPDAVAAAEGSNCDLVAVTPYLYWPTVVGVPALGRRVLFHGAAHDEPELQLPVMERVFGAVGGFAFNTYSERALVEKTFRVGHLPSAIVGNAVDEGAGDPMAARAALGLGRDEPFVLCLGKVERAKGSVGLASLWRMYRARRPDAPRLVFIGPVHDQGIASAADAGVILAGRQPDAVKWGALTACSLLIAPSGQESFSLVVLEAWLSGRPVLVNGRCQPTVEHCRRSGGGLWFEDYGDFEVAVDRLLADPELGAALAARGHAYTRSEFAWPALLDRYEALAGRVLAGRVLAGTGR